MMLIDNKFKIGDRVYLETDQDQHERMVTGFYIRHDSITYGLSCGTMETWHYDFEISVEKNVLKTSSN